jgi:alpha-D-ribose 1-methylphosphonate 5-triphosphate synthase subunit PhnG
MRKEAAFERREAVRVLASARKSELEASSLQAREHVLALRANALQLALPVRGFPYAQGGCL